MEKGSSAEATEAFWEQHYGRRAQVWSGRPNAMLVRFVEELAPGAALDLGCGEGGDAVWLAARGWQVTGVDVSATALQRAAQAAAAAGVAERVVLQRHDLSSSFPDGSFDLVSAQYFQSPLELPRGQILRRAAAAVRAEGRLLIVEHGSAPSWAPKGHHHRFSTAEDLLALLRLPQDQWIPEFVGEPVRTATGPDGQQGTIADAVVLLRRAGA